MVEPKSEEEQYNKWKLLIPYLYDWFANHNLTWPSLSCRWGPVVEQHTFKRKQRLYLSEQTDGSEPNKLVIMNADVVKPRVASADVIQKFNPNNKNALIKQYKTIYHPGEVNKIRECPQHPSVVVTHTDAPQLFVWSTERQPNRQGDKDKTASTPDLELVGHTDDAEFALGMCSSEPLVASGGKDTNVVLWSLADHVTNLSIHDQGTFDGKREKLSSRLTLKGHADTVEDVVFQPGSSAELASVADDSSLLFWDTRSGIAPVLKMAEAHGQSDLHVVDWSALRPELVATGAADGSLKVWDKRKLGPDGGSALFTFNHHTGAVLRAEWSPSAPGVLASGGEDRRVCVWDLEKTAAPSAAPEPGLEKRPGRAIPQLVFSHAGHRASVVDFQWNPHDPWTFMSVSDDVSDELGGGTLQLWRVNDLIYRDEAEVLAELDKHRQGLPCSSAGQDHILNIKDAPAPKAAGKGAKRTLEQAQLSADAVQEQHQPGSIQEAAQPASSALQPGSDAAAADTAMADGDQNTAAVITDQAMTEADGDPEAVKTGNTAMETDGQGATS
ncbi:MAG: WD-40 repeat-containing MSI4-like [Trebouxia sp. A1-2]|nr:MAG: WD-40 repeat-containing MSI4-like [Trebouxia sp. A1-2]